MADDPEIQSSAYVSKQILQSSSIPRKPSFSSKSRVDSREEKDGEVVDGESGYYEGRMDRFFQSEVRPIYFGKFRRR